MAAQRRYLLSALSQACWAYVSLSWWGPACSDSSASGASFLPDPRPASSAAQSGVGSSVAVGGVSSAGGVCRAVARFAAVCWVGVGMTWPTPVRRLLVPASCRGLDLADAERALVKHQANVSAAARDLGVPSGDLRKLTWSHPRLFDIALEEAERLIDRAEANVRRAVHDNAHPDRALQASIYVLSHHRAARERGWSRSSPAGSSYDDTPPQTIKVCWLGDSRGYQPALPAAPEERMRQVSAASSPADRRDADAPDTGRVH